MCLLFKRGLYSRAAYNSENTVYKKAVQINFVYEVALKHSTEMLLITKIKIFLRFFAIVGLVEKFD